MLKFNSISYGRGDGGKMIVTLELQDGRVVRNVVLTRRDLNNILQTIVQAFGVRLQ